MNKDVVYTFRLSNQEYLGVPLEDRLYFIGNFNKVEKKTDSSDPIINRLAKLPGFVVPLKAIPTRKVLEMVVGNAIYKYCNSVSLNDPISSVLIKLGGKEYEIDT